MPDLDFPKWRSYCYSFFSPLTFRWKELILRDNNTKTAKAKESFFWFKVLYVCFKFVWQEAVRIYYIPWPAKKNCCPKFLHKLVCQKQPKSVQPAQPTGQCCQKMSFKKTYGTKFVFTELNLYNQGFPSWKERLLLFFGLDAY